MWQDVGAIRQVGAASLLIAIAQGYSLLRSNLSEAGHRMLQKASVFQFDQWSIVINIMMAEKYGNDMHEQVNENGNHFKISSTR